jgi:hypothetical protein
MQLNYVAMEKINIFLMRLQILPLKLGISNSRIIFKS